MDEIKMDIKELIDKSPTLAIINSFVVTHNKLNNPCYKNILVSVSGGADSDIMIDIISKLDINKKVKYVWFDTGLEYQATKKHLNYLEEKYDVVIHREKAIKPIPISCKEYGQPFISKKVANNICRLQKHNFKWEDKPYNELLKEYPNCKAALMWWCNKYPDKYGVKSSFNINRNKYLKEFIVDNPPTFKISDKCCLYAKKMVAKNFRKNNEIDLNLYGVRKAEGGIRAAAYKNCFTSGQNKGVADDYRPIFWYKNEDKEAYKKAFDVKHSDCYTKYGFTRTGCAGCPFNKNFEVDLKVIETYEPNLFKAVNKIFGDSYRYTRKYKEYINQKKAEENGQINLFKILEAKIGG